MNDWFVSQIGPACYDFPHVPNNGDVEVKPTFYSNGTPLLLEPSYRVLERPNIPHHLSLPDFDFSLLHTSSFNDPPPPPPPLQQNITPVTPFIPELVPSSPFIGRNGGPNTSFSSATSLSPLIPFQYASTDVIQLPATPPTSPVTPFNFAPPLQTASVANPFSASSLLLHHDAFLIGSHHPSPLPLHHQLTPSFNFTSRPTTADGLDVEMPFAADFPRMNNPGPASSQVPPSSSLNKLLGTTVGEPPTDMNSDPEQPRLEPRFGPVTRSNRKTAASEREEPKKRSSAQPRPAAGTKAFAKASITKLRAAPLPSPPSSNERAFRGGMVDDSDLSDFDLDEAAGVYKSLSAKNDTPASRKTAPSRAKKRIHPPFPATPTPAPAPKAPKSRSSKLIKSTAAPTTRPTKTLPPRVANSAAALKPKSKVSTAKPPRPAAPPRRRVEALRPRTSSGSQSGSESGLSDLSGFTPSPPPMALKTEASGSAPPAKYPERRMVQNRTAQAKYRSKNKRLWELRWELGCDVGSYVTLFKEGHMSAGTAMGYLASFYDSYVEGTQSTCHTAGETLKDEVEERTASALAAATRNGKAR